MLTGFICKACHDRSVTTCCCRAINPCHVISSQEIQRQKAQLREKDSELEAIRCQPDHEKDQEIQRLRAAVQERDRAEATRNVLCSSLAEEADQLRGQLDVTVKVCQELMVRLEKDKRGGGELEDMAQMQKNTEVCNDLGAIDVFLMCSLDLMLRSHQLLL